MSLQARPRGGGHWYNPDRDLTQYFIPLLRWSIQKAECLYMKGSPEYDNLGKMSTEVILFHNDLSKHTLKPADLDARVKAILAIDPGVSSKLAEIVFHKMMQQYGIWVLEQLPETPDGKIDRAAVAMPTPPTPEKGC